MGTEETTEYAKKQPGYAKKQRNTRRNNRNRNKKHGFRLLPDLWQCLVACFLPHSPLEITRNLVFSINRIEK
ncbi:hypothetical protein [Bacteroides sp. AN502(2024)]|uniref:hypothetical protein n=1 Tax=Bacteroides sp. AN502(2024) TaxID=3160599 RepID=UPI003512F9D2